MWTDDPAMDFVLNEMEQEERAKLLPKCSICGETIFEETAVKFNGRWICDRCLDNLREVIEG